MKQDHFGKNLCHKHSADGCFLYRGGGRVLSSWGRRRFSFNSLRKLRFSNGGEGRSIRTKFWYCYGGWAC
jgi:hypothetical protein